MSKLIIPALIILLGCSGENQEMMIIHSENPSFQTEENRKILFEGTHNTRELGGYKTTDGKSVKWGKLFRSDKLENLSAGDLDYFNALNIREVIDFRSDLEVSEEPDKIPNNVIYRRIPIAADAAMRPYVESVLRNEADIDLGTLLVQANENFVLKYQEEYRNFLIALAENDQPKLFHCTAGKDRAGFAAALILLTLGVPKETVLEDYMKTNAANSDYVNSYLGKVKAMSLFQADVEKLRPVMGVQERYILKAFETIEENYGSVEVYLNEGLNISSETIGKLKEIYLDS
ncbi:MAG: tyrosine-protein phosphatase [Gammaproteobacteria bacterium]